MWNRLFKSKSSKEGTGKKRKFSSLIKNSSNESRSKASGSSKGTKVLSDAEDVIDTGPENVELVPCQICSRTFTPATLDKHVGICEKMHIQKRTPFDSFRQRREGTDLETYLPSNYGLIVKPKTSKLSPTDSKSASRSISSVYDASTKQASRRVTPTKEIPKLVSKETPLMNRSMMSKRNLGPINEVCPHCGRSFGIRAYDRHVEWCREKIRIAAPTLSAQQHLAKERMQARTKYKAPALRTKRDKNREKYSSLSESMNNLSDSGGVSILDFNSVADPYERGRKSSIMSLSMTSSIASDGGFSDKYDPFISAKRQFEDLFNGSGIATSTPAKEARSPTGANMSKSLVAAKSPSSPTKNQTLSKSNFRRTSSLRVPKKTSPISFMPKYKPSIQRGISDEGPISSNFLKPEEYDELPVKSHAVVPPDLVPKSPKPPTNHREPSREPSREPISSTPSPIVVKRQPCNSANRRNLLADVKNAADFPLTKTDSLAAFLKFEDELEDSLASKGGFTSKNDEKLSEKELKDKSNNLNKKSLSELIDNKTNDEFSGSDRLPAIEIQTQQRLQSNPIKLAPIEKPLIKHKIMLEPLTANHPECNNNNNNNNNNIRIDDNDNTIDSNLINSCDNLKLSNISKLPNESSSFDQSNHDCVNEATDASIENHLVTNTTNFNCNSTRSSSSAESIDSHQNMELIVNLKNINDTVDKRNPKRQMQLHKDNLLFDSAITIGSTESQIDQNKQLDEIDLNDNNKKNISITLPTSAKQQQKPPSKFDDDCNKIGRKLSAKDVQNIETLFDDFDLEEFISTFSDNEQFPIFKNYKEMGTGQQQLSSRKQHGSESTSEESEFDDKFDTSDIDVSERERTVSANSLIDRGDKYGSFGNTIAHKRRESIEEKPLKKPDVTVEAEKRMQIESELSKIGQKKHTTDTKLNQYQEILGESDEMSQAERELLASVQELNSMCDDSKTLDLTSDVLVSKTNDDPVSVEATFKSLFLRSPSEKSSSGSIRFSQRNRQQPILSYQMPEIVGLASSNANSKELGRFKAAPLEHLSSLKTESTKLSTNGTKLNASLNGFDRVLPPIGVHKNDSQNIYNTINMTSSYHHETRADTHNTSVNDQRTKLSSPRTETNSSTQYVSKFCHECGARFIVDHAKFCMDCGVKRATLD